MEFSLSTPPSSPPPFIDLSLGELETGPEEASLAVSPDPYIVTEDANLRDVREGVPVDEIAQILRGHMETQQYYGTCISLPHLNKLIVSKQPLPDFMQDEFEQFERTVGELKAEHRAEKEELQNQLDAALARIQALEEAARDTQLLREYRQVKRAREVSDDDSENELGKKKTRHDALDVASVAFQRASRGGARQN